MQNPAPCLHKISKHSHLAFIILRSALCLGAGGLCRLYSVHSVAHWRACKWIVSNLKKNFGTFWKTGFRTRQCIGWCPTVHNCEQPVGQPPYSSSSSFSSFSFFPFPISTTLWRPTVRCRAPSVQVIPCNVSKISNLYFPSLSGAVQPSTGCWNQQSQKWAIRDTPTHLVDRWNKDVKIMQDLKKCTLTCFKKALFILESFWGTFSLPLSETPYLSSCDMWHVTHHTWHTWHTVHDQR